MFQNAVQGAGRKIVVRVSGKRHASVLSRMFILTMTSSGCLQLPTVPLQQSDDIPYFHEGNSYLGVWPDRTPGHVAGSVPYRMVSIKVTLLISLSVVVPLRTLSSADSRRKRMPSSRAARRISEVGFFAKIISRIRSVKSSSS